MKSLMDKSIRKPTFAECYRSLLEKLLNAPEYSCSPRGMTINEITDCSFTIENPLSCMYKNDRRSSQEKYIAAELLWYFSGRRDLKFIEKYASFWKQIANADDTLNSAYGYLIFNRKNQHGKTQWQWAYDSLVADKDTRQAIIHFNTPDHQWDGNKDFVCTLTGNFHIRENKLNLAITMRSNDAILGTATDVAFFCVMQFQMLKLLQKVYPELTLGTYTHFAHSLHIYERHFNLVKEMLERDFIAEEVPTIKEGFVNSKGDMMDFIKSTMNHLDHETQPEFFFDEGIPCLETWIVKNLRTV
jgi:thymidylate synthase